MNPLLGPPVAHRPYGVLACSVESCTAAALRHPSHSAEGLGPFAPAHAFRLREACRIRDAFGRSRPKVCRQFQNATTLSLICAAVLALIACKAHGQSSAAPPTTSREMATAIGPSGRVLELQVPQQAQNSAEVLGILLDRRRTAGSERVVDPALSNGLRRTTRQILARSAPMAPHLFQVESAFRFDEPSGQTLMLICKSCQLPTAVIASERHGAVTLSTYFRIDPLQQLLEQASPDFRAVPSQRPVMQLPRN